MIVPMKKATIIVQKKDVFSIICDLRKCGLLHIEHQRAPLGQDINLINEDLSLINNALEILSEIEIIEECKDAHLERHFENWKLCARHIISLWKRINQLKEYSRSLIHAINEWQPWGDFSPESISGLAKKNIFLRLYQVPAKEIKNFPSHIIVERIFRAKGMIYCAVIEREKFECSFKEIVPPNMSLTKMKTRLEEDAKTAELLKNELHHLICFRWQLLEIKKSLEKDLEFKEVILGMGEASEFSYLAGYIPFDSTEVLLNQAKINKWGISISDPSAKDNVPTLVRNSKWISIIEPVFKVIDVVPGYHELDISLLFLIFFSIFFGMIIGDAGYGLIYLLAAFILQRKRGFKRNEKQIFFLFYILTSCAIIWGLLTGTFFGQSWLPKSIKPLLPILSDVKVIQTFCFFLGALHLSLAHSWRAMLKFPSLTALVDIGWILVLWTVFFLAKALILGDPFPIIGKWLIIAGVALVIFFTNPQKNILKTIGTGLGNLALSIMNNFTDVVSYVRLFAVGLAGVAVADTFNTMAYSISKGENIIAIILAALILVAGHGLNLVLGPMSILVHGIRLNVLEFCSHADVKWLGFSYKPLKEG